MAIFNINIESNIIDDNHIIGETVVIGDLLYLSSNEKWYKTKASLLSKSTTEIRIALEAGVLDDKISLLVYGYHVYESASFTAGAKYYLSITSGSITIQQYTGADRVIRYMGTAHDSTTLLFNPDQTYISDDRRKINGVAINFGHDHVEADITDLDKYTKEEVDTLIEENSTDKFYTYTNGASSTTWNINHALEKQYPSVIAYDTSGNEIEGDITYTDINNLIITFLTSMDGVAHLN